MKQSHILLALSMALGSACGKDEAPEERTPDLLFPLREADHSNHSPSLPQPEPRLAQHLIAQQRQLFTLLAGHDRAQLPHYVAPTYVWRYAAARRSTRQPRASADSLASSLAVRRSIVYLTLLGGLVPDGVKALPTNYHVFLQRGGFADVIASHEPDGP
ncbi:MAG: hypothetical protein ACREMA_16615, partial [Longimicrobiales bacterium]